MKAQTLEELIGTIGQGEHSPIMPDSADEELPEGFFDEEEEEDTFDEQAEEPDFQANLAEEMSEGYLEEISLTCKAGSKLKNFSCFIEEPYRGEDVVIHYPSMPNGEKLDDYCNKIYENLIRLYGDVFKVINNK